jgi:phosphatidyl-myo-inositol dimannoside synthase
MRIALLTYDFPPGTGGVQTYLYEIARRLAREHEVHVITPGAGERPGNSGLHYHNPGAMSALSFRRLLRPLQPDRVVAGHAHPQLLLAALATRLPYAAVAYGNDFLAAQRRWHRPLFNTLLGRARPFITITAANARRLVALGLPLPQVVRPGADPQRFRPPAEPPSLPPRLLTVARLVSRKGIDNVIAALPSLLDSFPDLTYHVAGDGPDRQRLERLATGAGVARAIRFAGFVPDAGFPALYQKTHVFVMPAREEIAGASIEGFGIVYLEASASGLPVVAGESGGAVEAVRDGVTGYLVPPDDPAALADTLRRLLGDEALRLRLGAAGRQWVESEMNWDRAASEFAALLTAGA